MTRDNLSADAVKRAGEILRAGGLVAFPTETVYGLGGDALNPKSAKKIYAAKGRPSDNPLIVHICRLEDLERAAQNIPEDAWRVAKEFWPGPLTMILEKKEIIPDETTGGLSTVAIRFPSDKIAQAVINAGGGLIAAPSANMSGRPSTTTAGHCIDDLDGKVDMIIDGGPTEIGLESTIIDFTGEVAEILRPGYITKEMLQSLLAKVDVDRGIISSDSGIAPRAPGMKYRHYAPRGELVIVEGPQEKVIESINRLSSGQREKGRRTGVICTNETSEHYHADSVKSTGDKSDEEAAARELFRILREFDDEHIDVIYSEPFLERGIGTAIMNRLMKAAGQRIIRV